MFFFFWFSWRDIIIIVSSVHGALTLELSQPYRRFTEYTGIRVIELITPCFFMEAAITLHTLQ